MNRYNFNPLDIVGRTPLGTYLTVVEFIGRKGVRNECYYLCRCKCGKLIEQKRGNLFDCKVKSCGCLRKERMERRRAEKEAKRLAAEKNEAEWDAMTAAENAKYKIRCPHTTPTCAISECNNRCCHECERYAICGKRCLNTPDRCGVR